MTGYAMAPIVNGAADWPALRAETLGPAARPQPTYEPATDRDGDALWLSPDGEAWWQADGTPDPTGPGWRRLYVRTGGEAS